MANEKRDISDGTLAVRTSTEADTCRVALRGELDLANAATAETALREALGDGAGQVLVDLSELEFIDSTGIALLVSALTDEGDGARLQFVPSRSPAVTRVLELTGLADRLPFVE